MRAAPSPCTARAPISHAGLCQPAGQRGQREHSEPDHEHASAPHQIGDPAAEEQETAEGQHVRVDHPGEARQREVKTAPDRRQSDVHDRRVEHDDELGHCQQRERPPAAINVTGSWACGCGD
jgi:hypothetical protein